MNEVLLCSFPQSCYFRDHHIHREDFMYMYMCSIDSILGHFSFQNARFYTFSTLQILLSVDNSTYTGLAFLPRTNNIYYWSVIFTVSVSSVFSVQNVSHM